MERVEKVFLAIDQYCRICMRTADDREEEMTSLYSERDGEVIANMIIDCADIMVCHDDELPENVCSECLARLEDAFALRKLIRESDTALREMAVQGPGVVAEEETEKNQTDPLDPNPGGRPIKKSAGKSIMYPSEDQIESVTTLDSYKVLRLKGVRCCGCDKTFPTAEEMTEHSTAEHSHKKDQQNTEGGGPVFRCSVCYEQFPTRMKLLNHTKNYESNEIYHCTVCDILFDIKYRLQQHQNLNKKHRKKPDKADADEESAAKPKKRNVARKRVTRELEYPDEEYILSVDDNDEYQVIHVGGERCCGCDEMFGTYAELQTHCEESHPPNEATSFQDDLDTCCECSLCHEKFDQIQSFNRHNSARAQKEFYYCKFCNLVIDVKYRFEQHLKSSVAHHTALVEAGIKSTYPLEDSAGTRTLESLVEVAHIAGVRCCGCNFDCATREELEDHSEETHGFQRIADSDVNPYECEICFQRFSESKLLKFHQNLAQQKTVYKCTRCEMQSEIKQRILQHLASADHDGEDFSKPPKPRMEIHMCCFMRCQEKFDDANDLIQHVEAEHDSKRRENAAEREYDEFICYVCHRSFRNEKALQAHQRPRKEFGPLCCGVCGASFQTATGMAQHARGHSLVRQFECDECEKSFADERTLRSHKISHDEDKPFVCEVCSKSFRRKGNLKVHKRSHRAANWQCPHCDAKLKTKPSLVLHIRTHTGEKPYQCRYCENRYSHTTDRQRHEMAAHTNERPHKCTICTAEFVRKRQLTIHQRVHTGERPYECQICHKGFAQSTYLTRHLATHEKNATPAEFEIEMLDEDSEDQEQYDLMDVLDDKQENDD